MSFITIAFLVSLGATLLIVRLAHIHGHRSADRDFSKPQGFHAVAVPRIGGLGVLLGLAAAGLAVAWQGAGGDPHLLLLLLACSLPAFLAGFIQDFTEAITPRGRLAATALSACIAFVVLDTQVRETAIPGLDWLVSFPVGSLAVTLFAVAGVANAMNIIDGFNGLASMCAMIMLAAVAYVAYQVGDDSVGLLALCGIAAVAGFFLWNFPRGLIFLGDGGAYFLGFFLAQAAILLIVRNDSVSPVFPLLVCVYPAFETLFSIYRRRWLRHRPAAEPDGIHLHSLIYRRIMNFAVGESDPSLLTMRNSMTSPVLWVLCMASVIPAVLFWDNSSALFVFLGLFGVSYVGLYWRIVRFRVPRWLRRLAEKAASAPAGDNERA